MDAPSRFYTGLVTELYESLRSEVTPAAPYARFVEASGQPALELACGSGDPLLALLAQGLDVEGLDASEDMLARCRTRAAAMGLSPVLHHQTMQDMALPRRYASVFVGGASFVLLPSDDDARATLAAVHRHLLPGGRLLVPLEGAEVPASIGVPREVRDASGAVLRVAAVDIELDEAGRTARTRFRYERVWPDGRAERLERTLHTRWWDAAAFLRMAEEAGFVDLRAIDEAGGPVPPEATRFVFLGRRPLA